jgi:threonine/homoserine/homoserine lactone efflux protein
MGVAILIGSGDIRSRVPLVIGLVLLATYALLRELDQYDPILFAMLAFVEVVIGLSALGEAVIGQVVNSPTGAIIVLVAGYLAYEAIQAYRASNKPRPLVVRAADGVRRRVR